MAGDVDTETDEIPKGLPRVGDVIAAKYRVEGVIAKGGMGLVVEGKHIQLGHRVAIKLLLPKEVRRAEASKRLVREARASVQIRSEHVVRVFDVGALDNGIPYIVMEYLEGKDLAALLKLRGRLNAEEAIDFMLQACEAIAEAHNLGIVHRDLKPPNLFLTRRADGSALVKVLDFGISKSIQPSASDLLDGTITSDRSMLGSPLYMSPEQLQSPSEVDARSDLWAMGAILFELLTGRPLFTAATLPALCAEVIGGEIPRLRLYLENVNPGLESVIARCLSRDMRRRYQNAADLAIALLPYAPNRSYASVQRVVNVVSPEAPTLDTERPTQQSNMQAVGETSIWIDGAGSPRRRFLVVAVGAGVIILTLLVFLMGSSVLSARNQPIHVVSADSPPSHAAPSSVASGSAAVPQPPRTVGSVVASTGPEASGAPAARATDSRSSRPWSTASAKPASTGADPFADRK